MEHSTGPDSSVSNEKAEQGGNTNNLRGVPRAKYWAGTGTSTFQTAATHSRQPRQPPQCGDRRQGQGKALAVYCSTAEVCGLTKYSPFLVDYQTFISLKYRSMQPRQPPQCGNRRQGQREALAVYCCSAEVWY